MLHPIFAFGLYRILASFLLQHCGIAYTRRPIGMNLSIQCVAAELVAIKVRVRLYCVLLAMMSTPLLLYQAKHM